MASISYAHRRRLVRGYRDARELEEFDEGIMVVERNSEAFGAAFVSCSTNLSETLSRDCKNVEVIRRAENRDDLAERIALLFRTCAPRRRYTAYSRVKSRLHFRSTIFAPDRGKPTSCRTYNGAAPAPRRATSS